MTAPIKTCNYCRAVGVMPTFMNGETVCYDCLQTLPKTLLEAWREIASLRAKITEMERQEPVAWMHETRRDSDVVTDAVKHVWGKVAVGSMAAYSIPLYALPGAQTQPTPSIPEGWKLVPIEPTEDMLRAMTDPFIAINGDNRKAFEIAYTAMLSAAPEVKP